MLLFLTLSAPKAEASYTYVNDTTYPDIGWMDVKQVGWDFNPNELLLTVQYQANIPNDSNHTCEGGFFLNTDQSLGTGDPAKFGADYYVFFGCSGDGSSHYCRLGWYSAGSWVFVKDLGYPFSSPGSDTVELGIPLADIGSPTAINIYLESDSKVYDYIKAKYAYNTDLEERSITVDGNPADWGSDLPDVTDPTGDASPGWADATSIYTTDGAGKLFMRIDLAAASLGPHPEEGSWWWHWVYIYFDTDRNTGTGLSIGGVGADYQLLPYTYASHASRHVTITLHKWNQTAGRFDWIPSATLENAAGTCLEMSLLLSDIGITGSKIFDVYVKNVFAHSRDLVPDSGTFTATKGANPPPRMLSEASTIILSAMANNVYFIYADPYRMVSPGAPWQAAFAAYDATAAGFLYGLCVNTQRICYDSNASIVVAKSPESGPPFNYGKMLLSSKSVVVMGGPIPNWVVDYYERTGQTPLKYSGNATHHRFLTQAGDTVAALSASADFTHNDLFVVMVFQDTNGNFVLVIYGLGWKGTFAGGIYFKEVIKPNLATYAKRAYVFRWTDAGPTMDGVPQAGEITKIYEWPI
jgi:hypothetical protein